MYVQYRYMCTCIYLTIINYPRAGTCIKNTVHVEVINKLQITCTRYRTTGYDIHTYTTCHVCMMYVCM